MNPFHNRPDEWKLYEPLVGKRMLELGGKINAPFTYKAYFQSLGFEHISVDWNAEHGALKRDLRVPLWDELGQFDMVTNIGTTEHIDGQAGAWENIHRMTKVGGVYVGLTPHSDGRNWWWHGEWYPTFEFFQSFAELNGWKIWELYVDRPEPFMNLYCRMQKEQDLPFTMPDLSLIVRNKQRSRHPAPDGCATPCPR